MEFCEKLLIFLKCVHILSLNSVMFDRLALSDLQLCGCDSGIDARSFVFHGLGDRGIYDTIPFVTTSPEDIPWLSHLSMVGRGRILAKIVIRDMGELQLVTFFSPLHWQSYESLVLQIRHTLIMCDSLLSDLVSEGNVVEGSSLKLCQLSSCGVTL